MIFRIPYQTTPYIKINVIIPKITSGSYRCSHSSKLFNGNKRLRQITKECLNSSVRYFNSLKILKFRLNRNCLQLNLHLIFSLMILEMNHRHL